MGQIYRGDIVANAYQAGAIGAVLFTDKKDYGGGGDGKGFPHDKWMPPSGVQVGTLYNGCGDPTTTGWPSTGGCERISDDEVDKGGDIPLIPSLPVSAADGEAIIKSIGGEMADNDWQGCKDGPVYNIGPGPGILNLSYTIGSTEWVEENREMLTSRVVAYLNVDVAVSGAGFQAAATPQLDQLLMQATKQVRDPENSSQSIFDSWVGTSDHPKIGRLGGAGSDYAPFLQHVGIPAADMSFGEGSNTSFYELLSAKKNADELTNELIDKNIDVTPLFKSIEDLKIAATKIDNEIKALERSKGWASMWGTKPRQVRELNDRLMMAERAFMDRDGLLGRQWYKHLRVHCDRCIRTRCYGGRVVTDRKDYGGGGDAKGFPGDKWIPPSGVQAGSLYKNLGDPRSNPARLAK
uniref:Transferrin receptor-like dimerisation domain-containing protein n=1 Tax=Daucus carota subsp. sativus TaxID=79200 RepID=A0A161Y292_DAUCS